MLIAKEVFGISVGDIVTTSYGSGPYRVTDISGPRFVSGGIYGAIAVRDYPVISLVLRYLDLRSHSDNYINDIRKVGDRYFTDSNDEIFVERRGVTVQFHMFESQPNLPEPYAFDPGVDYREDVYQCHCCHRDFNAVKAERWVNPYCPHCDCAIPAITIIWMRPGNPLETYHAT